MKIRIPSGVAALVEIQLPHSRILAFALCIGSLGCDSPTLATRDHSVPDLSGSWKGSVSNAFPLDFPACAGVDTSIPDHSFTMTLRQQVRGLSGTLTGDGGLSCLVTGRMFHTRGAFGLGTIVGLELAATDCTGGCREVSCASGSRHSLCVKGWSLISFGGPSRPNAGRMNHGVSLQLEAHDVETGAQTIAQRPLADLTMTR